MTTNNENEINYVDHILVADSSLLTRKAIMDILKKNGINREEYYEAQTGYQVLEILKSNQIDLAFIDWSLPGLDSLEIIKKVKKTTKYQDLAVIFLVNKKDKQNANSLFNDGVDDFIVKPINEDILWETVINLFLFHQHLNLRSNKITKNSHPFVLKLIDLLNEFKIDIKSKKILICSEDLNYWNPFLISEELPVGFVLQNKFREAVHEVEQNTPPLIILDSHFLKNKVDFFLNKIKDLVIASNIPIILIFESEDKYYRLTNDKKERYSSLGVVDYFSKESDYNQLYEFIGFVFVTWTVPYEKIGSLIASVSSHQERISSISDIKKQREDERLNRLKGGDVGLIADAEVGIKLEVRNPQSLSKDKVKYKTFQSLIQQPNIPNTFIIDFNQYSTKGISKRDFDEMFDFTKSVPNFEPSDVFIVIPSEMQELNNFLSSHEVTMDFLIIPNLNEAYELAKVRNHGREYLKENPIIIE